MVWQLFTKNKTREPFRKSTKKRAGENLEQRRNAQAMELMFGLGILVISLLGAIISIAMPKYSTGLFLVFALFGIYKMFRHYPVADRAHKGLHAERKVGEYLQPLERSGAKVLHDLSRGRWNVDHIIIHRTGVYVIETKYMSKPRRDEAVLEYRNGVLTHKGKSYPLGAVKQAEKNANHIRTMLSGLGHSPPVRPVVIIPGWFIERKSKGKNDTWVLNEKAFPKWLLKDPDLLDPNSITEIFNALRLAFEERPSNQWLD